MYIIKNALRCITRSPGRNILIGIIVLVIAISACLGLSIRQAAESARTETMDGLSVSATISFDRQNMMSQMTPPSDGDFGGGFDKDSFTEQMKGAQGLTLEEYQTYAKSEYVKDFTYSLSATFNGSDTLAPVTTGNLDTETQSKIMAIFRKLAADGRCVILVSHSPDVANCCDECYELKKISRKK